MALLAKIPIVAAVLVLTAAMGCGGGSEPYPESVRLNFLSSCVDGGGTSEQCECALEWFEEHTTLARFIEIEHELVGGELPDEMRDAIASCL